MHRVLVLYGTPQDPEAFRSYYLHTHLPLASALPGLRSLQYSFDLAGAEGPAPYFAVTEVEFDSADALDAALTSPAGQAVVADIPNYATGGAVMMDYSLHGTRAAGERSRPEVIGVHEIDLPESADVDAYERLAEVTAGEAVPRGLRVRLFRGVRGERKDRHLVVFEMETVGDWAALFPVEDPSYTSPALQAYIDAEPTAAQAWDGLLSFQPSTVFTDYRVLR
jgi:uncharacterized protein (TIGR02118 family)